MRWITKFADLLLYGNFWIAAAAVAMTWQTEWLLTGKLHLRALPAFIFCATLALYATHRLVGMEKVRPFRDQGRFRVIEHFQRHILVLAVAAGLAGLWFFLQLAAKVQVAVLFSGILSLAYVLPWLPGRRRLRDFPYLKIFLIALVWAWVSVLLPALALRLEWSIPLWIMFVERMLFVFAITLPFDIRDLKVDAHIRVRTLPALLGIRKTRILAAVSLSVMFLLVLLNDRVEAYATGVTAGLGLSVLISYVLIHLSPRCQHDYYFSGLLDGMMILQFVLVYGFSIMG